MNRVGSFAAALAAALAVAGCSAEAEVSIGGKSIDPAEAEQEISEALATAYGEGPESLSCPANVEPVEGETFTCTGESPAPESRPFEIEVTMTDNDGGIRYPTIVTFTDAPPPNNENAN